MGWVSLTRFTFGNLATVVHTAQAGFLSFFNGLGQFGLEWFGIGGGASVLYL